MAFFFGSCGVACQGVVGSYYTVTGNNYRDGIVTYCAADGLRGHGGNIIFGSDELGEGAVGGGLPIGDLTEMVPDLLAEGGALGSKGEGGGDRGFA